MATSNVLFARPYVAPFSPVTAALPQGNQRRVSSIAPPYSDDDSYTAAYSSSYVSSSDGEPEEFTIPKRSPPPKADVTQDRRPNILKAYNHLAAPAQHKAPSNLSHNSFDLGLPWRGGASSSSSRESSVSSSVRESTPRTAVRRQPSMKVENPLSQPNMTASQASEGAKGGVLYKFLEEQRRVRSRLAEMTVSQDRSRRSDALSENHGRHSDQVRESSPVGMWSPPEEDETETEDDEADFANRYHKDKRAAAAMIHASYEGTASNRVLQAAGSLVKLSSPQSRMPAGKSMTPATPLNKGAPMSKVPIPSTEPELTGTAQRRRLSCASTASRNANVLRPTLVTADLGNTMSHGPLTQIGEKTTELVDGIERPVVRRVTRIQRQGDRQRVQSNLQKPSPLASPSGPNRLLVRKPQITLQDFPPARQNSEASPMETPSSRDRGFTQRQSERRPQAETGVSRMTSQQVVPSLALPPTATNTSTMAANAAAATMTAASMAATSVGDESSKAGASRGGNINLVKSRGNTRRVSTTADVTLQQLRDLEKTQKQLATRQEKLERAQNEILENRRIKKVLTKSSSSTLLEIGPSEASESRELVAGHIASVSAGATARRRKQRTVVVDLAAAASSESRDSRTVETSRSAKRPVPLVDVDVRRLKLAGDKTTVIDSLRSARSNRARLALDQRPLSAGGSKYAASQYKGTAPSSPEKSSTGRSKGTMVSGSPDVSDELRSLKDVTSQLTATQQTIQSNNSSNQMFRLPDGFDPNHLQAPVLRDLCLRNIPLTTILPHNEIEFILLPSSNDKGASHHLKRISLPGASPSDLQRKGYHLHRINSGTFSSVYKAIWRGIEVAVKCPDENLLKSDGTMMRYRALQEWRILSRMSHPCVLHFHGGVILRDQLWLVTDYIKGGDLYSLLYHRPPEYLRPRIRLSLMEQLCEAVAYLHTLQPRVAHKDLKCNNLLVGSDLRLRVCDFGDAEEMNGKYLQFCTAATWQYTPPELIGTEDPARPQNATEKVDMWAVGCVFLEILRCATPFVHILDSVNDSRQRETLRQCYLQNRLQKECRIPSSLPPRLKMLVKSCLNFDSEARPSASELLEVIKASRDALLREMITWQSRWESQKAAQAGELKSLDGTMSRWNEQQQQQKEKAGGRLASIESSNEGLNGSITDKKNGKLSRFTMGNDQKYADKQPTNLRAEKSQIRTSSYRSTHRYQSFHPPGQMDLMQQPPAVIQEPPKPGQRAASMWENGSMLSQSNDMVVDPPQQQDWYMVPMQHGGMLKAPPPIQPVYRPRVPQSLHGYQEEQPPTPPMLDLSSAGAYAYTRHPSSLHMTPSYNPVQQQQISTRATGQYLDASLIPVHSTGERQPSLMLRLPAHSSIGGAPLSPRMAMMHRNSTETRTEHHSSLALSEYGQQRNNPYTSAAPPMQLSTTARRSPWQSQVYMMPNNSPIGGYAMRPAVYP